MVRSLLLIGCLGGLWQLSFGQARPPANPPITYTTEAIPASVAVDAISRMAESHLRVENDLLNEPLIIRVHYAPYNDVLDWIASALNATWMDKDGFRILHRTNFVALTLQKKSEHSKAAMLNEFFQRRQRSASKAPLTSALAEKQVRILYIAKIDNDSEPFRSARADSGDERLINAALEGIMASEVASSPYPNHVVFSDKPRVLQGFLRLSSAQLNKIFEEQNTWTAAVTKAGMMRFLRNKRLPILAKSRMLVKFSDAVAGLPTRLTVAVVGPGGHARVKAETAITYTNAQTKEKQILAGQHLSDPSLNSVSSAFLAALNGCSAGVSEELRNALLNPSSFDPLKFVFSDGLIHITAHAEWNMVACLPDSILLDPALGKLTPSVSATQLLSICQNACELKVDGHIVIIRPKDAYLAEQQRLPRPALQDYVGSISSKGYSLINSEASMASARPSNDTSLPNLYARFLSPHAGPFIDAPMSALAFYGSLAPDQRATLNRGMPYDVSDLTPAQKAMLPSVILDGLGHVIINSQAENVLTDFNDPEITDVIDSPILSGEKIFLQPKDETVVRVKGVDRFGRQRDDVFSLSEAARQIDKLGPWRSIQYATAKANTLKLTVHVTNSVDIAHFLREYPDGFTSFGKAATLPADVRKALGLK